MASLVSTISDGANSFASAVGGLLGIQNELARQRAANDSDFAKPTIVIFELQVPDGALPGITGTSSYLFPLAYAPQAISIQEPYAIEVTPGLDAALWTDESGVVQRRITISGNQGFFPHPVSSAPIAVRGIGSLLPKNYFDRGLQTTITQALSGARHQEYLRDTVFRAYSDGKRDPSTAANTRLMYHSTNDGDHFEVKPISYSTSRNVGSPFTVPYQIELLVVGRAAPKKLTGLDSDITVLQEIRNTVNALYGAAANIRGAIQDITATVGSFRILGQQVVGIIDQATSIVAAVDSLTTGVQFFLNLPLAACSALFNLISTTLNTYSNAVSTGQAIANWPDTIVAKFRMMQNATDILRTHPESFRPPLSQQLAALNQGNTVAAQGQNVAQAASFQDVLNAGSSDLPGDVTAASGNLTQLSFHDPYRSVIAVTVQQGDTLALLAQRYLGSVDYYRDIAILNNLRPPFTGADGRAQTSLIDAAQDTGVLAIGQLLQIPSTAAPPVPTQASAVLGADITEPVAVQLLGRDLALQGTQQAGNFFYDLTVARASDGTSDLGTVEGVANIQQAVVQRLTRIRGSCPLTPDVGVERIIGTGQLEADAAMLEFRLREQITADPRIINVSSFDVETDGITVAVDAQLAIAGLAATTSVNILS